jgi:RNA polymerase sigma-70 factor (ECF subfamily)
MDTPESDARRALTDDVVKTLVANHREFLAFVRRRVGNSELAEEIVQDAFVKSVGKADEIHDSAVGWFYAMLRNAITDHWRRQAAAGRKLDALAHEPTPSTTADVDAELQATACKCVGELADTLKPEYAAALRRIELDGVSVKDYAAEAGISASNAAVRVFRAREALRKQVTRACGTCAEHGCLDCTCESAIAAKAHGCGHV